MSSLNFAALQYPESENLGDDIQTLAGERHLPRVDLYLNRDRLDEVSGPGPIATMMNGWYLQSPEHWPPSPVIRPILTGIHITSTNTSAKLMLMGSGRDWLMRQQPIGCRDESTRTLLANAGITAEYVGCPTITFPDRGNAQDAKQVFLVQTEGIVVPRALSRGAVRVQQRVPRWASAETRRVFAGELLDYYRRNACLVVTTKLHCALPCAAMGIPVVMFADPADARMTPVVESIGINAFEADRLATSVAGRVRRRRENRRIATDVDWSPEPRDLTAIKQRVTQDIEARIAQVLAAAGAIT
ncbi:MAG: polysaccharide pyruvyl transferase family protein [Acidimicrobiales bacterium]|jgi:hypothetical protein